MRWQDVRIGPVEPVGVEYRRGDLPTIRASARAEVYETAACSGPAVSGTGRSRTRWAASAMERTLASSASRRERITAAAMPAPVTPATDTMAV